MTTAIKQVREAAILRSWHTGKFSFESNFPVCHDLYTVCIACQWHDGGHIGHNKY